MRTGGRVRQAAPERAEVQRVHGGTGLAPPVAAQQEDADLEQVQLLENQPPPRRGKVVRVFGRVDAPHGLRLGGHPVAGQQLGRQRVHKLVRERQRCMGAAGVAAGGQTVGTGIDRHKRAVSDLNFGAHQRVQQLAAGQRPADAPLKVVGLPHFQLVRRVGRIEPRQCQNAGIVRRQHPVHDPPALDAPGGLLLQHGCADAAFHVIRRGHDGVGLRVVDVFARIAQKQVANREDAELLKFFGEGRANALKELDGIVDGGHGGLLSLGWRAAMGCGAGGMNLSPTTGERLAACVCRGRRPRRSAEGSRPLPTKQKINGR